MSRNKTLEPRRGGRGPIGSVVSTAGSSRVAPPSSSVARGRRGENGASDVDNGRAQSREALACGRRRVSRESGEPPVIPSLDGAQPKDYADHWSLHSISEATFQVVVFHLRSLPPILHLRRRRTEPDWSQTQQGLLSPLSPSSPFP